MGNNFVRGAVTCVLAGLMLATAVPGAYAQEKVVGDGGPVSDSTLVDRIVAAASSGEASPEQIAELTAVPIEGPGSLAFDDAQRLSMTVMFAGDPDDGVIERVAALGAIDIVSKKYASAVVRIDPAQLDELRQLPGVATVIPVVEAATGASGQKMTRGLPTASVRSAAETSDGDPCGPIPIEADTPLRSAEARDIFGVDGTGVTVGIISDSFDLVQGDVTWADDVASGALPGPGNPCGRTTPVEVRSEHPFGGGDEGRAMAQLVHGVAPGARLLVASSGSSELAMATAIDDLVDAGADIIVDDIGFYTELSYQQGIISSAIMGARAQDVAYFTALGNANGVGAANSPAAGVPVGSWQTRKYRPMTCPAWVFSPGDPLDAQDVDCMDFDPGAAESAYDTLYMRRTQGDQPIEMSAVGSVGEAVLGTPTDYEWRYFEVAANGDVTQLGASLPKLAPDYPVFLGKVDAPSGGEIRMVLVRKSHDPTAPLPAFYTSYFNGAGGISHRTFMGDQVNDWVGESPLGHAGDGSATSVGSTQWDQPLTMRGYSSLGPSTLLFEPMKLGSSGPANRLSAPLLVGAPDLVAVDGTQTTFFGDESGNPAAPEYRFEGTSAAAPHAAAVAALGKSYAPEIDQASLTQQLLDTANGSVVNPYAPRFQDEHVFGAGLVDAVALMESLPARPAAPALTLSAATENGLQVAWAPGAAEHFVIEIFTGSIAPENVLEASQLPAGTATYSFTGLTPDTPYVVRLMPYGPLGVEGEAATLKVSTSGANSGTAAAAANADANASSDGGSSNANGGSDPGANADVKAAGAANGSPRGDLATTGGADLLPVVLGAGAVLIIGGVFVAIAAQRRKKQQHSVE